ncbi:Hypothetical_protein [Hexamita inflata]|uniref:Hypothetical_protein n=1 Tax=Hexamita inflata TaxID=28002 RepID=A0ABP1L267_9EUKA
MPIKLPIDSINTQIAGGPPENTRGQQFGVLIHFILSPVILNATFRFQNFHKLLRQFSLAPLKARVFPYGSRSLVPNILDQQKALTLSEYFERMRLDTQKYQLSCRFQVTKLYLLTVQSKIKANLYYLNFDIVNFIKFIYIRFIIGQKKKYTFFTSHFKSHQVVM